MSETTAATPVIEVADLRKIYRTDQVETHALAGVDLVVGEGEYVAVTGPSGCGKSTLMAILGLLDDPSVRKAVSPRK